MPDSENSDDQHEQQLDVLIAEYYRAEAAGKAPDHTEFITQHPEFAKELAEFFADVLMLHGPDRSNPHDPALEPTITPNASPRSKAAVGFVVRYFGEYEILEELGAGGMGVVYKARQTKLKRIVALKMIRSGALANSQDVQRFEAEAKAAAKLSHPGIVAVHEVGIHNGQHFYTMDYVEGGSLSRLHRDEPVASKRAAKLVRRLAESMHYAHQQGIIHRDLKPANILLGAKGAPRITDFGLAKRLRVDDETQGVTMTETGQILGTAGYMSPEQASGKTGLIGPPADIYALGAVLYALLTSRAPFVGESIADTILQVLQREPVSPRILNPSVPRDLETICLKCLEKEAHKRYGTAELLAKDLGRFVAGKPVKARPINSIERGWRACRRNPLVSVLLLTVAASLLIGSIVSMYFADTASRQAVENSRLAAQERVLREKAEQQQREAEAARLKADTNAKLARRHLYFAHMNMAQKAWDDRQIEMVLSLLDRHRPNEREEDLRGFEWHYWFRLCHSELIKLDQHRDAVNSLAVSSDGTLIASASRDQTVMLWNPATGNISHPLKGHIGSVNCVAISPNGSVVASAGDDGKIRLWDAASGRELSAAMEHAEPVQAIAYSPDGLTLASVDLGGIIQLWNTVSETSKYTLSGRAGIPCGMGISFSSDGRRFASLVPQGVGIWEVETGKLERTIMAENTRLHSVAFNPKGGTIAASGYGTITMWDADSGRRSWRKSGHANKEILGIRFSADGTRIASAGADQTAEIRDADSGTQVMTLRGHIGSVNDISFGRGGTTLVTASSDGTLKIWEALTSQESPTLSRFRCHATDVLFLPDNSSVLCEGGHGLIKRRDLQSGQETSFSGTYHESTACTTFSPTETQLAIGYLNKTVKLRSTIPGSQNIDLTGHTAGIIDVRYNFDGTKLLSTSHDHTIKVWDTATGRLLNDLVGHDGPVYEAVFSPDGTRIVSASDDGDIIVWQLTTDTPLQKFQGKGKVQQVAFSPDGSGVAAVWGQTVKFLNVETGDDVLSFSTHGSEVTDLTFSPDGARIATASQDGSVKLWDIMTGEQTLALNAYSGEVSCIAFSEDGTRLASTHASGAVKLWDAGVRKAVLDPIARTEVLKSRLLIESGPGLTSVQFSSDRPRVLFGGLDHRARLFNVETQVEVQAFHGHERAVWSVALSPDGRTAVTGSEDKTLRFWDVATGKELDRFTAEGIFSCVRYSTDGKVVFASNWDGKVRVWRPSADKLNTPVEFVLDSPPLDMVMLPDGKQFAIGTVSGQVLLCDAESGNVQETLEGHSGWVHSVEVVDGGRRILSASHDRTLRLWNLESGESPITYQGHTDIIHEVGVLPNGRQFLSCSADGTIRLWDLESQSELARGEYDGEIRGLSVTPDGTSFVTVGLDGSLRQWDLPHTTQGLTASADSDTLQWFTHEAFQSHFETNYGMKRRATDVYIQLNEATNQLLFAADWEATDRLDFIVRHDISDSVLEEQEAQAAQNGYTRVQLKTVTIEGVNHHIGLWTK